MVFTTVYWLWEIAVAGKAWVWSHDRLLLLQSHKAENAWFRVPLAAAIAMGAVLGLCWYDTIGRLLICQGIERWSY